MPDGFEPREGGKPIAQYSKPAAGRTGQNVLPEGVSLSGIAAWRLMASFLVDPVGCLDRHASRFGSAAIRLEQAAPWRLNDRLPLLLLIGPGFNREVLMANDLFRPTGVWPVRGPDGSAHESLRGNLLVMHGTEHARYSGAVTPHLARERVAGHFDEVKRIALDELERWPLGEIADICPLLRDLAQRYAFTLLFGEADLKTVRRFGSMIAQYHAANWSRVAALIRLNVPLSPYRNVLNRADELMAFLGEWLDERRGCPVDRDIRAALAPAVDGDCRLAADENVRASPQIIASAHLAAIALASYETTATTLAWSLLLLACHPQVAAALAEEIASAGAVETFDSPDFLDAMPLLDGVIRETLRLISPVPVLGFKTLRECELSGFELPVGTTVMLSPHLTHRLDTIYPDPDRFRPERWFSLRPTAYEYLPFSAGPRRCPGYHFAITNLRVALCAIFARYRLALPDGARIDRRYAAITMPRSGLPMQILPQDGRFRAGVGIKGNVFELFQVDE